MIKQLLLLVTMLLPVTAMANSVEIDGMYYNLNPNDKTAEVIDNPNKYTGSVVIPESVAHEGSEYSVTCIKIRAFYECRDLTSVTIPKSVRRIENFAFQGCSGLKKVIINDLESWCNIEFEHRASNPLTYAHHLYIDENTEVVELSIPNSVTNIGALAFYHCTALKLITIPNSVTSIGNSAFQGCTGLTSVTIPNSVTSIGSSAFGGCKNLTSVHITDLENWCKISFTGDAFDSDGHFLYINGEKIEELVIPNSITSIRDCAFSYCYGFKSVTIPNSVTSIGNSAFKSTGLTSVTIPNSVTSLGYYAFRDCRVLTSLKIGDSVISIGDGAFQNCTGLTTVDIPNSVTSIGNGAFSGCTGLTSVTIPNSVTYIGDGAFSGCTCFSVENGIRYVGPYLLEVEDKEQSSYIIKDGTRTIGSSAFDGCNNLTSVTIPNSVTYIGWQAFSCRSGLTSVTIPNSVTSIGDRAFSGCSGLTSVTIGNSLTSTGSMVFGGCSSLTSVHITDLEAWCKITFNTAESNPLCYAHHLYLNGSEITNLVIPNSVTSIGCNAFFGCSSLTSITIPNSVTNIGGGAFSGCTSLTSVTIPNSVTFIGDRAFSGCSGLTSITIPNTVTIIGGWAFMGCSGLTSVHITDLEAWCKISFSMAESNPLYYSHHLYLNGSDITNLVIPNSVTSIGDWAFSGCTGLTSVNIPNSVTSIGSGAFGGCTGLPSVNIPNSVTSIGSGAFGGCTGLTSVIVPNSLTRIEEGCFRNCTSLKTVTIPNSVTYIGDCAFYSCYCLTSVIIPNSVTTIERYAFAFCDLTSVKIGDSVISIGDEAFRCNQLTSVTIPNSMTSIGNDAFCQCYSLKTVISKMENPCPINSRCFENEVFNNSILYVPNGTIDKYKSTDFWSKFSHIEEGLPSGIKTLEKSKLELSNEMKHYDISGKRIYTPHKGLNIIDGKKVVIK